MSYLARCNVPNIADLQYPLTKPLFLKFFVNQVPESQAPRSFLANLVLVTDKAISEYLAARELIERYVSSGDRMQFVEAMWRFENCINSVRRAFHFLEKVKGYPELPNLERLDRRAVERFEKDIADIRNNIEHMDEEITKGTIKEGVPHTLTIDSECNRLEISSDSMPLSNLETTIRRLHSLTYQVLDIKPAKH